MSHLIRLHRSSRLLLSTAVAILLVMGMLSASPAAAHNFTKTDGNDSPGRLDIRTASVSHTSTSVVHRIATYNAWRSQSLGNDSFFVIQIDKNNDRVYERCAFIFNTNRLRGSLSNCGARFIRYLPVAKLSGTTARVTIPKSETGSVYWWGTASIWDGPAPCRNGCVDFSPNRFPDILHDMIPPVVNVTTTPLRVWESSTTANFTFPFSVSDAHSGMQSWTVQSRPVGSASWTAVVSGTGGGAKSPDIAGIEGTRVDYRVVARDRQGNQKVTPSRRVYIPIDDGDIDAGAYGNPATVPDASAFGGSYQEADSFTYVFTPSSGCDYFELVGPGSGDWVVQVWVNGTFAGLLIDEDFADAPRQTLFSSFPCVATTYFFDQTGGAGRFAVDAVLG